MARPGARATLGASLHGKDRVRVAKVRRGADGVHQFAELAVRVELVGGTDAAYVRGDNSMVVATDTCKNHVYMLAKTHACGTPEHFGADLAESFLAHYAHVRAAAVTVTEVPWRRVRTAGGAEHNHGFIRHADGGRAARAVATRVPGRQRPALELTSTLTGYVSPAAAGALLHRLGAFARACRVL
jgi:urate oxidase